MQVASLEALLDPEFPRRGGQIGVLSDMRLTRAGSATGSARTSDRVGIVRVLT